MCSGIRFTDDEGNMYFARNLDWNCGYGQKVTVTPRGYERHYAFGVESRQNYAVIGPCIVIGGVPLYFDCANEKGLAIAGLNFPATPSSRQMPSRARPTSRHMSFPCG